MTVAEVARPKTAVGLYPGLTRTAYEQIQAVNVSSLVEFERTPAHARAAMLHSRQPTEAMNFGTALHCAVLEQQRFLQHYAVAPKVDRRTKTGKDAWAQFEADHPGVEILDADDFNTVQRMRESVWANPISKQLLGGMGHNEVGIVFDLSFENLAGEGVSLLGKSLIDRLGQFDSWSWVVDLKSCVDADRRGFSRAVRTLQYGAKAAYYVDACNAVAPRKRRFVWIAVEKTPPYATAVYECDDSALSAGRSKYMRWLRLFEEAKRLNSWPGYPAEIQQLGVEDTEWNLR